MAASTRSKLIALLGILAALLLGGAALASTGNEPSSALTSNTSASETVPAFEVVPVEALEPLSNPVTVPSPTNVTTTIPAVSGKVRLPVPEGLPADAYAETPEQIIGSIIIPRLGVEETLYVGMTLTALNRGPSQWPGTALPGELGNIVVGGHRTTYSRPFQNLDKLVPGDQVIYRTTRGEFTYALRTIEIVDPSQLTIADQKAAFTSTLFACHPPGSAESRIVAHLEMVGPDGKPMPIGSVEVVNAEEITRFRTG